jgi:hypothetical protein
VRPRAGLDAVAKRKIPSSRRESNPERSDRPARSLVAIPTELLAVTLQQVTRGNCLMRILIIFILRQILLVDKIMKNEIGGAYSTHDMRNVYKILLRNREEKRLLG